MQALEFLEGFESSEVDWLLSNATPRTVLSDGILIREGSAPEALYFVTDGMFDVLVETEGGKRVKIGRCSPGEIIGELSWLDRKATSASVVASESSAVLALPIEALDAKVANDGYFAGRFYRAVALITSARLRSVLARSRRLEPDAPRESDGIEGRLLERISEFKALLLAADKRALQNGNIITTQDDASIRTGFRELLTGLNHLIGYDSLLSETARDALGAVAQRELMPLVQLAYTAERFFSKPRGYAGDYFTIEMIYRNIPTGSGRIGPMLDACFLDEPAARAVVNRRRLLVTEILATCRAASQKPARVMSLACGPAREVFDSFEELDDPASLVVTAVDIDKDALHLVAERSKECGVEDRVDVRQGNLIYLATGREQLDLPRQDLVYSIGLIDYFNDKFVVALINWIYDRLAPGGRVVLGNFHPRNSTKATMDHVLEWRLIHRDEEEMHKLFEQSKFGRRCTRIFFEEENINLFAECVR